MAEQETQGAGTDEEPAAEELATGETHPAGGEGAAGKERRPRAKGAYFLSTLALLAGLGALGAGGYVYWQWDARWAALDGRLSAQDDQLDRLRERLQSQDKALSQARAVIEAAPDQAGQTEIMHHCVPDG